MLKGYMFTWFWLVVCETLVLWSGGSRSAEEHGLKESWVQIPSLPLGAAWWSWQDSCLSTSQLLHQ